MRETLVQGLCPDCKYGNHSEHVQHWCSSGVLKYIYGICFCNGECVDATEETEEKTFSHDIKFHLGEHIVVCTCGEYFETQRFVSWPKNAIQLWAEHVADTLQP